MKKTYIMPSLGLVENLTETETLLTESTAISSDLGIGYGGVDEDGEIEASSRRQSFWEE